MNGIAEMKLRFGDVIVDLETNVIHIAGKEKRLEPKLIALLTYLTENAQQVITRQQITDAVWPNVVVGEESVTQAIFALRNALNDDAKRPKYIETIPKKGYRFLADVTAIQAAIEEKAALPSPVKSKRKIAIASGISLLLVIALLGYTFRPHSQYEIAHILPVTTMTGAECCMSINSNRKMVFINVLEKVKDLYVKDLTTGTQERITQDEWQKGLPLWLDNNTIIYPRCLHSECQIVRQSLRQSPQVIYNTTHFIGEIALAPNNPNLLIFNEEHETSEFISFDLRSGKYEPLRNQYADLPPHILHPIFSNDARQLFFVNVNPKPALMALDLMTKKIESISDQFDEINSFSLDNQQQLIIAGAHKSTIGLWLLRKAKEEPTLIVRASGGEKLQFPLVDPVEKTLYYQSVEFDQNIGMATAETEAADDFSELNSTGVDNLAVFSKDEQFLYFVSNRTGFSEVWRYDFATKQTKPITHMKLATINFILVSNDGQRICLNYINNMQSTLGVFSIHNGELLKSTISQSHPLSWSSDDKYIYVKEDRDNLPSLIRYDSQTLTATEIQRNVGAVAQDSKDGSSVIFLDLNRNALVEKNMTTGQDQELMAIDMEPNRRMTGLLRIDANNTSALVVTKNKDLHQLWQYPFKTQDAAPHKVMDLPKSSWITFISADGSKVLYDQEMPPAGNIMKINFQ